MAKILCKYHNDKVPSMEIYPDGGYCFVCGVFVPIDELGVEPSERKPPTDIPKMVSYIDSLPSRRFRGIILPHDNDGFYIVWPDRSFYKKRMFDGPIRYTGPRGHRAPLMVIPGNKTLVIVEGEMNALSLGNQKETVVTSGSATELMKHLSYYLTFDKILCIMDKDVPGVAHGLELKDRMVRNSKKFKLIARETDYNDVLVKEGKEGLQKEFQKDLEMCPWVQNG